MHHQVAARDRVLPGGGVLDRSLDELDAVRVVSEVLDSAGGEIIEHHDVDAGSSQSVDEVGTDEPGATRDADSPEHPVQTLLDS